MSSPAGYPRTCFFFGHDDVQALSHDVVRDAIKPGGHFVGQFLGPNDDWAGGEALIHSIDDLPSLFDGWEIVDQDRAMLVDFGLAEMHLARGEREKALARYWSVLVKAPDNVRARQRIAEIEKAGKK